MDLLWWVIVGMVAAVALKRLLPSDDAGSSVIVDVLLGVFGAVTGGFMVRTFAIGHDVSAYFLWTTVFALGGAMSLVFGVGLLTSQPRA